MSHQSIRDYFQNHKKFLIDHYPGLNEKRLIQEFGNYTPEQLNQNLSQLSLGIPLEYISGKSYFYNSEYLVNQYTLIPRFETEQLVEMAKSLIKENNRVIDIGTGTGNIILSLLQELAFPIKAFAVDISPDCIELAKMNDFRLRFKYHPESTLEFFVRDRFKDEKEYYDLILSNPPYIKKQNDKNSVHHQVLKFEPHLALFLEDKEYENWFHQFFHDACEHLNIGGYFLMEGHENHLPLLTKMADDFFAHVEIIQDLSGRDRFLKARKV